MIPAGNFSSIGMKSVTSLRRAVFTTTSQSSPMLRRRRTSTSTTTTSSEERNVRRRSLSSHSFEKLERSDSWSSAVVGRRHSRRSLASLSTSSVENLATLHFSKAEKDRGPTFESRGTNFLTTRNDFHRRRCRPEIRGKFFEPFHFFGCNNYLIILPSVAINLL